MNELFAKAAYKGITKTFFSHHPHALSRLREQSPTTSFNELFSHQLRNHASTKPTGKRRKTAKNGYLDRSLNVPSSHSQSRKHGGHRAQFKLCPKILFITGDFNHSVRSTLNFQHKIALRLVINRGRKKRQLTRSRFFIVLLSLFP